MALAALRFAHPVCQLLFVLSDNLNAVIRAAAVDDDVLKIRVTLLQDGEDGLFKELPLVEGGGDY